MRQPKAKFLTGKNRTKNCGKKANWQKKDFCLNKDDYVQNKCKKNQIWVIRAQ